MAAFRKTITLPNGKRKDFYANTQQELADKILNAKMQMRAGIDLSENLEFGEFAQMWYTTCKKPKIRAATQDYYKNVLNNHILPYIGNIPIRNIRPMHIAALMNKMEDLSKEINRKTLQTLRAIFNFAVDNNLIMKSPIPISLKPGGQAAEKKESLTCSQERLLLETLKGSGAYPFALIALNTGMRRGEICGLMWDCVDLKNGVIHVRRNLVFGDTTSSLNDYPKTGCSVRDLPITPVLDAELRRMKAESNSLFVLHQMNGRHLTKSSFRAMWENVNRRRADPNKKPQYGSLNRCIDFPVSPHILRHTFLTRCFENGLDLKEVQYLAGHATPDLTMKIYVHYQEDERKTATFTKVRAMDFS